MRRLLRPRVILGTLIVVPTASALGLYGYVQYRVATKPVHSPRVLVHPDGNLITPEGEAIHVTTLNYAMRTAQLVCMYFPLFVLYYVMCHNRYTYHIWLRMMLFAVRRSGPAIVKAGQWACTRYDMFTPEFRKVFACLFKECGEHSVQVSYAIIENDFKRPVSDIFSEFDPKPIGSGSIGQVHQAVLRDTREKVAVKVMHPNTVRDISRDIYLINMLARFVDRWVPSVDFLCLPDTALAWTNHLAAQIDFRVEMENLVSFQDNFKDIAYVKFPRPIRSTKQVLIESFEIGEAMTNEMLARQSDYMKDKLSFAGMNCLCKMLLRDNFIHSDMHPGNFLISTDSDPPSVTLIDVGLVQRLGEKEAHLSNELMSGFCYWDPERIARTFLAMGSKQKWCNEKKFIQDMKNLLQFYRPQGKDGEYAVIGDVLAGCFNVIRENKVQMDSQYVNLMFSVLILESFIMTLNPMFNIAVNCAPWLVSEGHVSAWVWGSLFMSTMAKVRSELFGERVEVQNKSERLKQPI